MGTDSVSIYVDTNIFLHYPPLAQMNWCQIAEAKRVNLIVCMPVIHELDRMKSDGLLADRASRALKDVEQYAKRPAVQADVECSIDVAELRPADMEGDLLHDVQDDRIIALAMRAGRNTAIAIATEDTAMRLKCASRGIQWVSPPWKIRLETPADARSKELRQLQQENLALKNRRPQLLIEVSFGEGEPPDDQAALLPFEQRASPTVDIEGGKHRARMLRHLASQSRSEQDDADELDATEDNAGFLQAVEQFLWEAQRYVMRAPDTLAVWFWLRNAGTTPADDIDVQIVFPKASFEDVAPFPEQRGWTIPPRWQFSPDDLAAILRSPEAESMLKPAPLFTIAKKAKMAMEPRAWVAEWTVARLRHSKRELLGRVDCLLPERAPFVPFKLQTRIRNAQEAAPSMGFVHVPLVVRIPRRPG